MPWLPTFIDQQSHALNTEPAHADGLALDTLTAYGGGIARGDVFLCRGAARAGRAGAARLACCRRIGGRRALVLLLWLLPLGLVLALGLRSGLFEVRYLVLSLPGLALLAGLGIVASGAHPVLASRRSALLALVPAALGLSAQYFDPALARDDYRGLVAAIERDARPTDAVLLSAPNQIEIFELLLPRAAGRPSACPPSGRSTRRTRCSDSTRSRPSTSGSGSCRGR